MAADSTSPDPPVTPSRNSGEDAWEHAGLAPLLNPGRLLAGKYRVDGILGRGGMGVVAAGRQVELDRPVAVKFLRPGAAGQARRSRRFAREAQAIAKIRSEHVVRVFDVGVEEGVPFIVMERLVGHDLATELRRGRPPWNLVVQWLLHACEAIGEAHSLGIVHRDIKPSNLFLAETLGKRRVLKVLDFGVSKWLGPGPDLQTPLVTTEHAFLGTPAFVSPEQLTHPDAVDERADVWALGVVLYQCLCDRLPFEADSIPRLCAEILTAEPPALFPPNVPDALREVTLRCLKKTPSRRYPSVLELARALSHFEPSVGAQVLASLEPLAARNGGPNVGVPDGAGLEAPALAATPTTLEPADDTVASSQSQHALTPAAAPSLRRRGSLLVVLAVAGLLGVGLAVSRRHHEPVPSEQPSAVEHPSRTPPLGSEPRKLEPNDTSVVAQVASAAPSATVDIAASREPASARKREPSARNTPKPATSSSAARTQQELDAGTSSAPAPDAAPVDDFDRTRIFRR